jgi:hypothetical protein
MTTWKKRCWVLFFIATGVLPAYANNPPQPDGLFSILLIFPIVIVGLRLAGVHLRHAGRGWTVVKVVMLVVSAVLSAAGDGIGLLGLLVMFCYGFVRGIQIIRRGSGWRGYVAGSVVILWVLFAVSDYYASLVEWPHVAASESGAVAGLRTLDNAENTFKQTVGTYGTLAGSFSTLDELYHAKLIDDSFLGGRDRNGYRYFEVLSPTKKQFVFYAVPVHYPAVPLRSLVPGGSLLSALHLRENPRATAVRAFAVDDSGVIRYSPDGSSAPATRQEIENWKELE